MSKTNKRKTFFVNPKSIINGLITFALETVFADISVARVNMAEDDTVRLLLYPQESDTDKKEGDLAEGHDGGHATQAAEVTASSQRGRRGRRRSAPRKQVGQKGI